MTTTTVTTHRVRNDVADTTTDRTAGPTRPSNRWALAGLGAGVAGIGTIVSSSLVDAVYRPELAGDSAAITEKLGDQLWQMLAFHLFTGVAAVLMIVFAAGLYRRLRATAAEDSIAPLVAFSGMLGTAVVLLIGSGLDTEFMAGLMHIEESQVDPSTAVFFNNWIGTIPWIWVLVGLAGIAVHVVARTGGVPRWMGRVGLLGGGLTLLLGISPLQYMAGFTGPIGLTVIALGFLVGDKAYRKAA